MPPHIVAMTGQKNKCDAPRFFAALTKPCVGELGFPPACAFTAATMPLRHFHSGCRRRIIIWYKLIILGNRCRAAFSCDGIFICNRHHSRHAVDRWVSRTPFPRDTNTQETHAKPIRKMMQTSIDQYPHLEGYPHNEFLLSHKSRRPVIDMLICQKTLTALTH